MIQGKQGYLVYHQDDSLMGKSLAAYGEYFEAEISIFRQICQEGYTVVDVGAHIGAHTVALANLVGSHGHVYAFEPQRQHFQALCANMAINSIDHVDCYQAQLSSESIESLDSFLTLSQLDFMRIDVGGREFQVIEGARTSIAEHQPILYVRNENLDKSQALIEQIRALGYRMFWDFPPLFNPKNFAGNPENIFGQTIAVNMLGFHQSLQMELKGMVEVYDSSYHPIRESS